MKKAFLLLTLTATFYSCNKGTTIPENTTAEASVASSAFGAPFSQENAIKASALQQKIAGKDSIQATVSAEIVESCQAKGCWADVKLADNKTMKVTFRNYAFFLPVEDLKGRTVIFSGAAKREVVSVEDQRHYAQDAGKSADEIAAITEPKEELLFVADGIVLK